MQLAWVASSGSTFLSISGVVALAVVTPGQAVPALGTATITHRQMSEHHKSSPVTHTHANAARVAAQESTITLPNSDGRLEQFWRGSDCAPCGATRAQRHA